MSKLTVFDNQGRIKQTPLTFSITGDVTPAVCQGRLTLTTGVPVTTSDVTAAATLYFTPDLGNMVGLYDGVSAWTVSTFTERSLSLAALTASTNYDIFLYDNSGTLTLEAVAWTNATTRATALTTQDGILVKSGATTRRYLGTIRITGTTGQTEDSLLNRFVWNYYNRVVRLLRVADATGHAYGTAVWRAWNADAAINIDFVVGLAEEPVQLSLWTQTRAGAAGRRPLVSVAYDVTNNYLGTTIAILEHRDTNAIRFGTMPSHIPGIGYHFYQIVENAADGASSNFDAAELEAHLYG